MPATARSSPQGGSVRRDRRCGAGRVIKAGGGPRKGDLPQRRGRKGPVSNGARAGTGDRATLAAGPEAETAPAGQGSLPDPAVMARMRAMEDELRAVGLTPEQAVELRAWIAAEQQEVHARRLDPEAWNHALLSFMQQVPVVLGLRPVEVEARTGVKHQHQRRLKPVPDGMGESHVSLCTVVRWANGLGLRLPRLLERLLRQFYALLLLWEDLPA